MGSTQNIHRQSVGWLPRSCFGKQIFLMTTLTCLLSLGLGSALGAAAVYKRIATRAISDTSAVSSSLPRKTAIANEESQTNAPEGQLCLTPGCVHSAASVLKNMKLEVNPCDDFYDFACGAFVRDTLIPDDKTSVNGFNVIHEKLQEQLRVTIEAPVTEDEPKPSRMVKHLYKACMNKSLIEERGITPAKELLKKLGGWPVLEGDDWDAGSFSWLQSVYKFKEHGFSVDYFIDFSVATDLKNSTKRIIDLDQGSLGLSREYFIKGIEDKVVSAYYSYMVDLAVLFGADKNRAQSELKESLIFEMTLANISLPNEKRRNATKLYNPRSIEELQKEYPSIPWMEYFNKILPPSVQVKTDEVVVINVPSYVAELEKLVSNTPKRVQANYVLWRAAAALVSYLTEEVRKRQLKYYTTLSGKTEREPRWKECIDMVTGSLSIAVGSQYVKRYFKEEAKKNSQDMVEDIRAEFIKILKTIDWMDDETRVNALEKAAAMATHIAYPDELLDDSKIIEFYDKLEVSPHLYLESVLNMTMFGTEFSFSRLRKPVNKTDWITHGRPAVVNAYYSSIENSIQFPAGILQGVFFSNDRPRYMNYGAIGFVIGHEITHGFDDQGRQFDKEGNLVDWWKTSTKEQYLKRAQCIIEQYGNYSVPEVGLKLNGVNTQGENIADNGGVKEAYYAYNSWVERNGEEGLLPGLNFTQKQMFWISAANVWCSKYRPETIKLRILTGFHSPGQFRVNGPLSNLPEFARDFNCPLGSKMNPEHKCSVW
ncbi:neprilysin-2 isoform X2 [Neocloeon triangulifer]|uniref:neprilysin-2 isoform X2 n=1 Tax=Neocloeon triangulifer TaxID=2078957 RepID=UPI00286F051E|nr:neprilysin-2 isoform X2 [Neocloeon triangulifer]